MEELGGGVTNLPQHRASPFPDRFLGTPEPESISPTSPVEFSEQDIFNTPSGSSSKSAAFLNPNSAKSHSPGQYGILAALNDNVRPRSGCAIRPVFNRKVSTTASLSSTSPGISGTGGMMIPRRHPHPFPPQPPAERMRLRHQSAPVEVPLIPVEMVRRASNLDNILPDDNEEEQDEDNSGRILPPHEMLAARQSPAFASSVLEGAGRTLKGRDLRQVRNAIWRKTGFLD